MSAPVYTSVDDVKAFLQLTGTGYDAQIADDIAAAARWIDDRSSSIRFWRDNTTSARKFIPENPGYCIIDALTELSSLVAQESTWVLDQDFFLEPINAPADGRPYTAIRTIARPFIFTRAEMVAGWAAFDGRITVTGKWGWPAVPDQIVKANILQAARYFHRRNAPLGVISFSTEVGFRMAGIDADVASLMEPFGFVSLF